MKKLPTLLLGFSFLVSTAALAETPVEIKLVAPIEEERGWCLDLRGGQPNAVPIGGVHGHTCYTYQGNGPSRDQGFIKENILEQNEFRMVEFNDKCMTMYEAKAGSFISLENCDGRTAQQIVFNESGTVTPRIMPELCMTMGSVVLPGGGGTPLHIMRDVTFEECEPEPGELQVWTLRAEYDGPEETTAERPFVANPNARPPGGGGMGGGMGMGMGGQQ
jgi:hypothetical protein